jgi:hydroxymethylbilane synthase
MAIWQSELVAEKLRAAHPGLVVDLVPITTAGDADQVSPLSSGEGAGWFTTAIQDALVRGEVDIAVHSYKDLPTKRPPGLMIAAIPVRGDPRDAFIGRTAKRLNTLKPGAVVGTSSPRRTAQLLGIRGDIEVRTIRGNVDTRIAKLDAGEYDAIVVAYAGLVRLSAEKRATSIFGYEEMLPAPAQGALAVECRTDDTATRHLIRPIDDADLRYAVTAERTFLARLEAGCNFPAAAYAERFGSTLKLHALIAPGGRIFRSKMAGPLETAAGLGRALADELLALSK